MSDSEREKVLGRVNGFLDSADALSNDVAGQQGLPLAVAPVFDAVLRAAETVRNQSATETNFRAATSKLELATAGLQTLKATMGTLPPALQAVEQEIKDLTDVLTRAQQKGGKVDVSTDGVAQLIDALVQKADVGSKPAEGSSRRSPIAVRGAAGSGTDSLNRLDDVRARITRARVSQKPVEERWVRETQLKTVTIDFKTAEKLRELELPSGDSSNEEAQAHHAGGGRAL